MPDEPQRAVVIPGICAGRRGSSCMIPPTWWLRAHVLTVAQDPPTNPAAVARYTMPLTHADLAPHPNAGLGPMVECEHGYGRLLVPPTNEPEPCWFDTVQRPIRANAVYVAGRGCGMTLTSMLAVGE
jgi:hypothetical protein